jgi:hypothetical protein
MEAMGMSWKELLPVCISLASLCLSAYAIWVVQFNHGRLKMTQPSLICLKKEFPAGRPKLFLRTCLFATGTKGRVIEHMFVRLHNTYGSHTFDFWGHTADSRLTLGSGLFVGPTGVASDHHFNPREGVNRADVIYVDGEYRIEVFASIVGKKKAEKLSTLTFSVNGNQAAEVIQIPQRDLYLLWNADSRRYDAHVRHDSEPLDSDALGIDVNKVLANVFAYKPVNQ